MSSWDHGKEKYRSRILGEWSNLIGSKMNHSSVGVYTASKTFPVDNFKHGWKNDMVVIMGAHFANGILHRSSFLGNLKPLDKKLGLHRTPPRSFFDFVFGTISSIVPIVTSNNLVTGWNSWPTGALHHHSRKQPSIFHPFALHKVKWGVEFNKHHVTCAHEPVINNLINDLFVWTNNFFVQFHVSKEGNNYSIANNTNNLLHKCYATSDGSMVKCHITFVGLMGIFSSIGHQHLSDTLENFWLRMDTKRTHVMMRLDFVPNIW